MLKPGNLISDKYHKPMQQNKNFKNTISFFVHVANVCAANNFLKESEWSANHPSDLHKIFEMISLAINNN